ncbi:unnamed protein product [Candidatus Protochlamydia amoebophila UWE25]|uniref:Uncharacterized protein n=1 Tax=Protochlamydia amoebophila (strain UWE25) TaxID=264201 RepID=Q6MC53_PARUW|nr:unnamed protein product [Candidatus Protochlamydia amoebophila UWE25]
MGFKQDNIHILSIPQCLGFLKNDLTKFGENITCGFPKKLFLSLQIIDTERQELESLIHCRIFQNTQDEGPV